MRIKYLKNLLSPARYRCAARDFEHPWHALRAASDAFRGEFQLQARDGSQILTNRTDQWVWEAYFQPEHCRIEINDGLFVITPNNPDHPSYRIRGGNYGFTLEPQLWHPLARTHPLLSLMRGKERSDYSQHGEDGVLDCLLELIPIEHRYVIEFGAHDGISMSNSRHLIANRGWDGFLIEPDPVYFRKLEALYNGTDGVQTLESFVTPDNIDELFRHASAPTQFGVMSIDIDSIDYQVWAGLSDFQPRIVIAEFNPMIPPDRRYVVSEMDAVRSSLSSRMNASLLSWHELGIEKGYRLVYCESTGSNLFFVHEDCIDLLDVEGLSPEVLYQPPQFGLLAGNNTVNGRGFP